MKAIILAAGRGSRMKDLTDERPKCLVELRGKALLDWQLEALRTAGITEIAIVTGYKRELLANRGLVEFHNARWAETNMVSSLACAQDWLQADPCIVSYSDIFYSPMAVQSLMTCEVSLAASYDPNWLELWTQRFGDPLLDAETFRMTPEHTLAEIGNKPTSVDEVQGQYMGLLRFTPAGWAEVLRIRSGLTSEQCDKMHMTGTLQKVIEAKSVSIATVPYTGEWGEVDSAEDLMLFNGENNMHVFVLVPVHNRVDHTKKVIDCLRRQSFNRLSIIVIDDGSTDATHDLLATCQDITTLQGDGTLWWAGAMALGLSHIASIATDDDFVLFLNNDTLFEPNYVQTLLDTSREIGCGVVGSILRDVKPPYDILSIGPVIDVWRIRVFDKWLEMTPYEKAHLVEKYSLMAVSGRGSLYPVKVLNRIGGLCPRLLPHYYADYELSARASRLGIPVVISTKSVIYTENDFGVNKIFSGFFDKYFNERSYRNVIRVIIFWSLIGTVLQRCTAIPRLLYRAIFRKIRRIAGSIFKAFPFFKQGHARLRTLRYAFRLRTSIQANKSDLKIIIGASSTAMPGWVSTEYPCVDVASKENLNMWFSPGSVKAILAEHVLEYLTLDQATSAIGNCMALLEPGGYLRIAVPDGNHPDKDYIEYVKPGGYGEGSDDNKILYTIESLSQLLLNAGFKVEPLEWFDSDGQFHVEPWDAAKGMISRSTRFDLRNHVNPTAYVSIIVDAVKPVTR